MKVKIGPYLKFWGPYQISDLLFAAPRVIDPEEETWRNRWADRLGDWLARTPLASFCDWVYSKRNRQVYVHIDDYDVWNMDATLQPIIGPMLVRLKEIKHGSGQVEDCDVPEQLRSTSCEPKEHEWDLDANFHLRYSWLLDELIWAFNTDHDAEREKFWDWSAVDKNGSVNDQVRQLRVDREGIDAYNKRLTNAYCLFGKYYQTLWD